MTPFPYSMCVLKVHRSMPYLSSRAVERVGVPEKGRSMLTLSVAGLVFCDVTEDFCDTSFGCLLSVNINSIHKFSFVYYILLHLQGIL